MGSNMSCLSKQKAPKSSKKSKNLKKKANVALDLVENNNHNDDQKNVVEQKAENLVLTANGRPKSVSPTKTIICMSSAPSTHKLPTPHVALEKINKLVVPTSSDILRDSKNGSKYHKNQPSDHEARQLARGEPQPTNWRDLHWNLIESRHLTSEDEIIRALFTWLCSLDPNRIVFPEQTKKDLDAKRPLPLDSVERVVNGLIDGRSTYFQTLCNQVGIESHVVRGIAKGVLYEVGTKLDWDEGSVPMLDPKTNKLHPQIVHLEHAWNACKVEGKWYLFDPSWAARRLAVGLPNEREENKENEDLKSNPISQASQNALLQYQTDMFYFKIQPSHLLFTHFPVDSRWQLLKSPGSLKRFQDSVLLKPSFFRYGLGIYSHPEGYIPVKNELTLKFLLPEIDTEKLSFTFNLNLEGLGQIYKGKNLSTYGIHTISPLEKMVTFMFRFPKQGVYKLIIYACKLGENLFADVCEYKIHALYDVENPRESVLNASPNKKAIKSIDEPPIILPFPPCNQSSYGPTAKAAIFGVQTLPINLDPILQAKGGFIEIRFCQVESGTYENLNWIEAYYYGFNFRSGHYFQIKKLDKNLAKNMKEREEFYKDQPLPKLAARLKSIQWKDSELNSFILHRQVEASKATTGFSSMWTTTSNQGACIPMNVVTAYLPNVGEYALEIFAKHNDSNEEESYHIVWQFLITTNECWVLSEFTQDRLAMIELGSREPEWSRLNLKTVSHQDPLIRIPTIASYDADLNKRKRTEKELLSEFALTNSSVGSNLGHHLGGFPSDNSEMGSQVTVIEQDINESRSDRTNVISPISITQRTLTPVEEVLADIGPKDCDLQVVLETPNRNDIILLAQMVDISSENEAEQDVTNYVLKAIEDEEDKIHREELIGGISDSFFSQGNRINGPGDRITYLIRVPKGGRFYKLFFYACHKDTNPEEQIPLVYTYLIEAPARLTSSEQPYIGSLGGPFPQKTKNSQKVSLRI